MPASLDDVVSVLRTGNQNMSRLIQALGGVSSGSSSSSGPVNSVLKGTGSGSEFSKSPSLETLTLVSTALVGSGSAGAEEYDGKVFYQTSVASSRQVTQTMQFVTVQGSDVSLSNSSTSAQNIFASGGDVLSLAASTTYQFDAQLFVGTGSTPHTTALALSASSAFTSILYQSQLWKTNTGSVGLVTPYILDVSSSSSTVLNSSSTSNLTTIVVRGLLRTNLASTMTPQITFDAGPGGTCAVKTESFFRIWPLGTNTVTAVGNWA